MTDRSFQQQYNTLRQTVERQLSLLISGRQPRTVYEPMTYVLNAGGKRVRAILVLLACKAAGGNIRQALHAACAIEILHNFTLVHDDVMDNASLRRGRATVHAAWDANVAILAGDELVAYAYRSLLATKSPNLYKMMTSFTNAFIEVCEGQGFDKEFESRRGVTLQDYLEMIKKKTAKIISSAAELGAIAGNGTERQVASFKKYGEALGMAFQIQDDLLDIAGSEDVLGKPIGGDVMEGKKTYVLLKALGLAIGNDKRVLQSVVEKKGVTKETVMKTLQIYRRTGALDAAGNEVTRYTHLAERALIELKPSKAKEMLIWLSRQLLQRNS